MHKPEEYTVRIVAHPHGESRYDKAICTAARDVVLRCIKEISKLTKTALAEALGLSRGRTTATLKALGLQDALQIEKDERAAEKSTE